MEDIIEVRCLATGSSGNCWVINYKEQTLLIECGISLDEIKRSGAIKSFSNVVGVLISHSHNDHCKCEKDLKFRLDDIYDTSNTTVGQTLKLGTFKVLILPALHNVDIHSFLIKETETGKTIFFYTDTTFIPCLKDRKYDLFISEVNYSEYDVERKGEGHYNDNHSAFYNHCSLEKLCEYLEDREFKPSQLVIHHMSNSNNLDIARAVRILKEYVPRTYFASRTFKIFI